MIPSATQTVIFNDLRSLIPILERLIWQMYFSNEKYFNSWIFEGWCRIIFKLWHSKLWLINFQIKIYKLRFLTGALEDRGIVILSNKIQSIIMCLYISKIKNQFATLSSIPIDMFNSNRIFPRSKWKKSMEIFPSRSTNRIATLLQRNFISSKTVG